MIEEAGAAGLDRSRQKVPTRPAVEIVTVSPADLPTAWRGAAEWTDEHGMWQPWRVSRKELKTCLLDVLTLTARVMIPNGVRIVLHTDAEALEIDTIGDPDREGRIDVVSDGTMLSRCAVPHPFSTAHVDLPVGPKTVEVWLPHSSRTRVSSVRLYGSSFVEPGAWPSARWIAYGSSITQCNTAPGPTRTWPALVSRQLSWDLTALGMAGRCQLDPAVARVIRDTPADLLFLCLGINVYGRSTFDERSLPRAATCFVKTVRSGHPTVPIVVMTPIGSTDREQVTNDVGLTLSRVRELVRNAAETLRDEGDDRVVLIDGLSVLSLDEQHLLRDGLHPTPEGYEHMARRLAPRLEEVLRLHR